MNCPVITRDDFSDKKALQEKVLQAEGTVTLGFDVLKDFPEGTEVLRALGVKAIYFSDSEDKYLYEKSLSPSQMNWEIYKWRCRYPTISFEFLTPASHSSRWQNQKVLQLAKRPGCRLFWSLLLKLHLFLEAPKRISR